MNWHCAQNHEPMSRTPQPGDNIRILFSCGHERVVEDTNYKIRAVRNIASGENSLSMYSMTFYELDSDDEWYCEETDFEFVDD